MTISEIDEQLENLREQICFLTYDRPNQDRTLYEAVEDNMRRERLENEYAELEERRIELSHEDDSSFGEEIF